MWGSAAQPYSTSVSSWSLLSCQVAHLETEGLGPAARLIHCVLVRNLVILIKDLHRSLCIVSNNVMLCCGSARRCQPKARLWCRCSVLDLETSHLTLTQRNISTGSSGYFDLSQCPSKLAKCPHLILHLTEITAVGSFVSVILKRPLCTQIG